MLLSRLLKKTRRQRQRTCNLRPFQWAVRRPAKHAVGRALVVACALTARLVTGQAACVYGADSTDLAARRAEIEQMTSVELQHLRHKQERFAKFSADEQQRMRRLNDDLERDPHGAELRRVLVRYHEWLESLAPGDRTELLELEPAERIERIEQIKQQQAAQRQQEVSEAPTLADLQALLTWVDDFSWRHHEQLFASLPPGRRSYLEGLDASKQHRATMWMLMQRWHGGRNPTLRPSAADVKQLFDRLSPGARLKLELATDPMAKGQLIAEWLQLAVRHRRETGGIRQMLPPISESELQRFFREELTSAQREALFELTRDQKHRVLMQLYFQPADRLANLLPDQLPSGLFKAGRRPKPEPRAAK